MYPALTKENKIAGLEMIDLIILLAVYLVVFLISRNLFLNLGFLSSAYLFLRLYKRKKPPRYTQSLIRFLMIASRYTQAREVAPP